MKTRALVPLVVVGLLLAACSAAPSTDRGDDPGTSTSPSATTAPPSPSPEPSTAAAQITPDPRRATEDQISYGDRTCHQDKRSSKVLTCVFGDPQGDVEIVAVGDSKTEQYLSVLDRVGKDRGWRVVSMTKSACAFSTAQLAGGPNPNASWKACEDWNRNALRKIDRLKPDAVFTALYKLKVPQFGRGLSGDEQRTLMAEGIHDALERTGVPSVVLRATPRAESADDVAVCVEKNRRDPSRCDITGDTVSDPELVWTSAGMDVILDGLDQGTAMSINNLMCSSDRRCESVADGILRYRDSHHLTETFLLSIADAFGSRLERALVRVGVEP
ncbi:SGNH hydrolase domain-containing protein [Aeromicrobium massiliense]|uniref:SGNH hydrolase domain-containing protein n=1 Tax=Aeromicrobium massiliense TaxID=1464554 RepID=UPI0002D9306C|nr:SGNH hydrolase domain-containing protein [Aeromicrobium massiliense]